ncbi:MAG TPA: hypothetical protein VK190_02930 [Pseudoneobacillus sp.]|nr:hypothetical protein [Pseudoneobacillus sp.]
MEMTEKKVIELNPEEITPVEEAAQEGPKIAVALIVGMQTDGQLFFNVEGQADLLHLEGLISYSRKQLDKMWEVALAPRQAAPTEVPVEEAK